MTVHYVARPHRSPRPTRRELAPRLAVLFSVAVAALILAPVGAATAIDNGTLGIRPDSESDFFHLAVLPGEKIMSNAVISNHSTTPVTLLSYVVDGSTTTAGAFALQPEASPRLAVGLWSTVQSQIIVPGKSSVTVPFTLTVPAGTLPGDYAGGLIIQSAPIPGTTSTSNGAAVRIDVIQRQGARIYLTVPGHATLAQKLGILQWEKTGNSLVFTLPITNLGNSTLHPTAVLTTGSWFGTTVRTPFTAPESVPPGATVHLTHTIPLPSRIQIGQATATLTSAAGTATSSTSLITIPWIITALAVVTLALLIVGVWRLSLLVRHIRQALNYARDPLSATQPAPTAEPHPDRPVQIVGRSTLQHLPPSGP